MHLMTDKLTIVGKGADSEKVSGDTHNEKSDNIRISS